MRRLLGYFSVLCLLVSLTGCNADKKVSDVTQSSSTETASEPTTSAINEVDSRYKDVPFIVSDISIQQYQGRQAAAITFSAPLSSEQSLVNWLQIESASGEKLDGSWVLSDQGTTLYFPGLSPETDYNIRVLRGLPSELNKSLTQDFYQSVSTPALSPILGFASKGNLLAHQLKEGLPVLTVNASQVDVDFYRIPIALLAGFLTENARGGQLDFWRVRESIPSFELVYSGRFDLNVDKNVQATRYLPINKIEPLKNSGVYLAVMRQAGAYEYEYPATWFAVTDLGVQLKQYNDQIDVVVNALSTALPVAAASVTLLDSQGEVLVTHQSSPEGLVSFRAISTLKESPALLMAQVGSDTTIVKLFGPALDLSEFPVTGLAPSTQTLYLYSNRDLYRPGEQITISGLLRGLDGEMVAASVLRASLQQPDGRVVGTQRIGANELNYYEVSFPLTSDAPTGEWRVTFKLPDDQQVDYPFQVEDFLPERMAVMLDAPTQLKPQDALTVNVVGEYLYGAPAAGNMLQSRLITSMEPHPFDEYTQYHFGDVRERRFDRQVDLPTLSLNDQGKVEVKPDNFWATTQVPLRLKLFESVLDSGGRPVSRSITSHVLPAPQLVGIRPLFAEDTADYNGTASFELLYTDGNKKLSVSDTKVTLVREERRYHWIYAEGEGWRNNYTERHYPVFEQTVSIPADSTSTVDLPVEWGYYRLEVKHPETGLISSYRFRAGWSEQEQTLSGRPDRIGMSLDKSAYLPGDTLSLRLQPPAGGQGYLVVEGDQPLYWKKIDVPADGATIEIPVDKDWARHDLYISVTLIQPGEERDEKMPRRMMGIQPLPIDRESRRLQVEMELPEHARPETRITIPLTVKNGNAIPESLQVTLAAVDMGVLNITNFPTPDPFKGFFGQRRYQVENRDSYGDLIDAAEGSVAELRFGGDADLQRGGTEPPTDVQIVSLFSGVVEVDDEGQASVDVQLPDFNGKLRLMAVAFGEKTFGSTEAELTVAAPIVTQLTTPRFLAVGDQSELALDLHNLSGQAQNLTLSLVLDSGLEVLSEHVLSQAVSLQDKQKTTLRIPVRAAAALGLNGIEMTLTGLVGIEQESITRTWYLGTRPAWPGVEHRWQQRLSEGEAFTLPQTPLTSLIPNSVQASVAVSSKPPLNIASHLQALKAYPYGCLEQTTSGVFAQIYSDQALLAQLGIKGENDETRQAAVQLAIQRLMGMQKSSGGFGLWGQQSPEEYWLTVYVTDFLLRARDHGYAVPADNLEQAMQRLKTYLKTPRRINSEYAQNQELTRFSVAAYAAQVLSGRDQAPLAELRNLYDLKGQSWTPLGLLQLGLALERSGDSVRAKDALSGAQVSLLGETSLSTEYGSRTRDLSLALFWSLEAKLPDEYWEPLLFALQERLASRQWLSTQERNALFLAGRLLETAAGHMLDIAVMQGSGESRIGQRSALREHFSIEDLSGGLIVENRNEAPAYLTARLSGYSLEAPTPLDQGIQLERRYFDLKGSRLKTTDFKVGELLLVELAYKVEEAMPHLLIVDLLPAGLELENQNLATAFDLQDVKREGESIVSLMQSLDIRYQEFRDDRYVAAVNTGWRRDGRLYYLARAVSSGEFTIPPTFAEDMYRPELRHMGGAAGKVRVRLD